MGVWDHLKEPREALPLLTHPANDATAGIIEELLRELRATSGRDDLRAVQEHLTAALIDVESRYRVARRHQKRSPGDQLEVLFWRRACVQLRCVGDAIAWHFLDFRRQWVLLHGRNQHPGIMSDKAGFGDEVSKFTEHWEAGEPTLFNALTNCITIGDLLVADGATLTNMEVKRTPGQSRREQSDRASRLVHQINEEHVVDLHDGPVHVIETDVPLVSYWSAADASIQRALDAGAAGWVPTPGVSVRFMSWPTLHALGEEGAERAIETERRGLTAAVGYDGHRVPLFSKDLPYLTVPIATINVAPMSIYPIQTEHAAALITGRVLFVVEIFIDRIVEELQAQGLVVENLLEGIPVGELPQTILRVRRGPVRSSIHRNVLHQLAYELLDPAVWARAFASNVSSPPTGARRWGAHFCMADEGQVWW